MSLLSEITGWDAVSNAADNYYRSQNPQGSSFEDVDALYMKMLNRHITQQEYKDSSYDSQSLSQITADITGSPEYKNIQNTQQEAKDKAATDVSGNPLYKQITDATNKIIAKGLPTFSAEYTNQWLPQINAIYAPYEKQATDNLNATYAANSALSYGSSPQMKATSDMLSTIASNKMAQALSLGETQFNAEKSAYDTAVGVQGGIAGVQNENQLAVLNNTWNRQAGDIQAGYAKDIAALYQPPKQEWWQQLLIPAVQGAAGAATKAAIAAI